MTEESSKGRTPGFEPESAGSTPASSTNENEWLALARWLGFKTIAFGEIEALEFEGARFFNGPPEFRTSNGWAGALLEKLVSYGVDLYTDESSPPRWRLYLNQGIKVRNCPTWRDAVVEAALEIIKRENQA